MGSERVKGGGRMDARAEDPFLHTLGQPCGRAQYEDMLDS
jgi:hypothetical protein